MLPGLAVAAESRAAQPSSQAGCICHRTALLEALQAPPVVATLSDEDGWPVLCWADCLHAVLGAGLPGVIDLWHADMAELISTLDSLA